MFARQLRGSHNTGGRFKVGDPTTQRTSLLPLSSFPHPHSLLLLLLLLMYTHFLWLSPFFIAFHFFTLTVSLSFSPSGKPSPPLSVPTPPICVSKILTHIHCKIVRIWKKSSDPCSYVSRHDCCLSVCLFKCLSVYLLILELSVFTPFYFTD